MDIDTYTRLQMDRGYVWAEVSHWRSSRYCHDPMMHGQSLMNVQQAALSVLIRNFSFELIDGPNTKLEKHVAILPRPKLAGETTALLPMRVRQVHD